MRAQPARVSFVTGRRTPRDGGRSRPAAVACGLLAILTAAVLGALGAELTAAFRTPPPAQADREGAANAERVARFYAEVWSDGDLRRVGEFVAADHVYHDPTNPAVAAGVAGVASVVAAQRSAFPDLALALDDVVAHGDRVAVRFTLRGTHRGEVLGADGTDRAIAVTGAAVFRLAHRMIAETWVAWDTFGLAQQVGLFLVPARALGDWEGAPGGAPPGQAH